MNRRGFTLIELAVALSLVVVVTGLVVVRVDGWSSRQKLRTSARRLGNTIRFYREMAQLHEEVYGVSLDLEGGTYKVLALEERTFFGKPAKIREGRLSSGQKFGSVLIGEIEMASPFMMILGPRGVLPEIQIGIENGSDELVILTVEALVNEVGYEEPEEPTE